jgi:hypothetical protein
MNVSGNPTQRILVNVLIFLGMILMIFFGLRTIRALQEFRGHRPPSPFTTDQPETDASMMHDWMTIPCISRMYHVPPPILFKAMDIPEHGNKEKSLKQLNDEYYPQAKGIVLQKIKVAVLTELANQTQPAHNLPDTPVAP